ncbi:Peptidase M35 deuterolysin [Macrophomina phaseolina MS6]|uniref:Peptidase M35 deuterolysin n=1 Tax=Macrophomina phaseolina (strain MS6) TaxID=1126212 RepID=K2S0L0_MACPH|nr:Peptidase M35 deuterolysin [Macrophomina phaseolina MS6]
MRALLHLLLLALLVLVHCAPSPNGRPADEGLMMAKDEDPDDGPDLPVDPMEIANLRQIWCKKCKPQPKYEFKEDFTYAPDKVWYGDFVSYCVLGFAAKYASSLAKNLGNVDPWGYPWGKSPIHTRRDSFNHIRLSDGFADLDLPFDRGTQVTFAGGEVASLNVSIERTGNTKVEAHIHNTGTTDLHLLKSKSILDERRLEKLAVFHTENGTALPFKESNRPSGNETTLGSEHDWSFIQAKTTIHVEVDIADMYDLSLGGNYTVVLADFLIARPDGSTEIGMLEFAVPQTALISVDGAKAAEALAPHLQSTLEARYRIVDCDETGLNSKLRKGRAACTRVAAAASREALIAEHFGIAKDR